MAEPTIQIANANGQAEPAANAAPSPTQQAAEQDAPHPMGGGSGSSLSSLSGKLKDSMAGMCQEFGIPPEIGEKLMGMFGGSMQMVEMVMSIMEKFSQHGAQGHGGELGNPQANLAPPTPAAAQELQVLGPSGPQ